MSSFNEIEKILSENLTLNKARLNGICLLIFALIGANKIVHLLADREFVGNGWTIPYQAEL